MSSASREIITSKANTSTTYDALGRPLTVTDPDGRVTTTSYNIISSVTINGLNRFLQTAVIDASSHQTDQLSNARGQLARVRQYTGSSSYTLKPME